MAPANKGKQRNLKANNEKKKELMRKLREQIKNEPVKYEEAKKKERERYHSRKQAGKIKTIDLMSPREKRKVRKNWRERSKKCYDSKKENEALENRLIENTPPASPANSLNLNAPRVEDNRISARKKLRRKNRRILKEKIKKLEEKLKIAEKKTEKYKKKAQRLENNKKETPTKKVKCLVKNQNVSSQIRKQLLFNEVMIKQMRENFKDKTKYRHVIEGVAGKIIKKYRMQTMLRKILSSKMLQSSNKDKKIKAQKTKELFRKHISDFLEKDEHSRLCPGKKDTVTLKKDKRQKRYLNDSLLNLHKTFSLENPHLKLSYSTFCCFRPFWIVPPKVTDRDTCLCVIHENMSLLTNTLYHKKIICYNSPQQLCKALCCEGEHIKEECLDRSCNLCKNKLITILPTCEENETINLKQWISKKVPVKVKGVEKICTKSVKEEFTTTAKKSFEMLQKSIFKFMKHVRNVKHQQTTVRNIRENLKSDEVLIHSDFSENYGCKYGSEIQSAHFGGSKAQLSLHTVVVYYKCMESKTVLPKSFCTVSADLRHDSFAVCAHLEPVIEEVKRMVPKLNTVHFLSDSVVNQYRNKTIFHLIGTHLSKILQVNQIRWHYSESGHGKGAPDGIGGCLKRNADNLVASGQDISSYEQFLFQLTKQCPGVKIIPVETNDIDKLMNPMNLETFTGTLQIHEVAWSVEANNVLQARQLSCLECSASTSCKHYGIGQIHLAIPKNFASTKKATPHDNEAPGTSNKPVNEMKLRCPPRARQKLQYYDVYSDSDVEDKPQKVKPKVNDYVITRIAGKKTIHYYIGLVIKMSNDELDIKFMKKSSNYKFVFPEEDDISLVEPSDVLTILDQPIINNRQQYQFNLHSFRELFK